MWVEKGASTLDKRGKIVERPLRIGHVALLYSNLATVSHDECR